MSNSTKARLKQERAGKVKTRKGHIRPLTMLQDMRAVYRQTPDKDQGEGQKLCRQLQEENPKEFLARLAALERAYRQESLQNESPTGKKKKDQGAERLDDLITSLLSAAAAAALPPAPPLPEPAPAPPPPPPPPPAPKSALHFWQHPGSTLPMDHGQTSCSRERGHFPRPQGRICFCGALHFDPQGKPTTRPGVHPLPAHDEVASQARKGADTDNDRQGRQQDLSHFVEGPRDAAVSDQLV